MLHVEEINIYPAYVPKHNSDHKKEINFQTSL